MKKDLFENIGERLNQYESPVDFDTEWKGILDQQKKSRKRRVIFWLSSAAMVLLLSVGYYFLVEKSQEIPLVKAEAFSNNRTPIVSNTNNTDIIEKDLATNVEVKESSVGNNVSNIKIPKITDVHRTNQALENFEERIENTTTIDAKWTTSIPEPKVDLNTVLSNDVPLTNENKIFSNNSISDLESFDIDLPISTRALNPLQVVEILNEETSGKKRKIELFANGGVGITQQQFKGKDSADEPFSELRNSNEQPLETYTYDAGVNIFLNKKSFLSIGGTYSINFDRIHHQYELAKPFDFENVLLKRITYPNGTVEEIYGDTTLMGSETITGKQYNKYTTVSINASFGHYFLQKGKLRLGITGGLSHNISLKAEGKTLDAENPNGAFVALNNYKKSYGLGLLGGIEIDYKISKKLFFNIHPSISYSMSSATLNDYPLSSKFYRYGLTAGIKYNL